MWEFKTSAKKKSKPEIKSQINPVTKKDTPVVELSSAPPEKKANKTLIKANENYYLIRDQLHQKMIKLIDLKSMELMTASQMKPIIEKLVIDSLKEDKAPVNEEERDRLVTDLQDEILGLGPLEKLLGDDSISEIMINKFDKIFVERFGKIELIPDRFSDSPHLLKIIDKIITRVGRRIDELNPMADARLADGSRVNAIIPPIALDGPAMSIRKFAVVPFKMEDLIRRKSITKEIAELLSGLVKAKTNILISGGTGSGKTTLLNILSGYIPDHERIITIEDTAELQLQQNHVIRLESRPPNIEEKGEVSIRALVRNSLRMRPDRIVLGEVRAGEVIDMLQAMNTGHEGSLTTIHANSARDALSRMESLIGMGGVSNVPSKVLRQQISSAINIIVQISRLSDGSRKIMSIHEITGMEGDVISSQELFYFDRKTTDKNGMVIGQFRATGVRPNLSEKLTSYGITLDQSLFDPEKIFE
jgi:pilus assembly protein CpaF